MYRWEHPAVVRSLPLPTLAQPRLGVWRTFWSCVERIAGRLVWQ